MEGRRIEERTVPELATPATAAAAAGGSSSSGAAEGSPVTLGPGGGSGSRDPPVVRMDEDNGSRGQRRSADEAGMDLGALTRSQPVKEATGEIHVLGYVGIEAVNFCEAVLPREVNRSCGGFPFDTGVSL